MASARPEAGPGGRGAKHSWISAGVIDGGNTGGGFGATRLGPGGNTALDGSKLDGPPLIEKLDGPVEFPGAMATGK